MVARRDQPSVIIYDTTKPKDVIKVAVMEAKRMVIPVDNEGFLDLRPPTWH